MRPPKQRPDETSLRFVQETHYTFTRLAAAGLLLVTVPPQTLAQAFPSRPLELVVHTGPGAGADRISRLIAEILAKEKLITQPITVVNRTGGAGTVAFNYMLSPACKAHAKTNHYENTWMGSAEFTRYMTERQVWVREFLRSIGATAKP
jgi:hypothetical protein